MPFRFALLAMLALPVFAATDSIAPGSLTTPKGICPLRHTDVQVRIAGPLARVTVTQEFYNPFAEKIEAVYTFPLPPDSAVDDMTMHVGDRTIRGLIKPRDEARKIYDEARRTGRIASLLDQERPNIFTQAVANIVPGATVKIEIAYVETVPYEAGAYSFNFPMVVAPRYMPRRGVPDAGRIAPPVTPEGTRAGPRYLGRGPPGCRRTCREPGIAHSRRRDRAPQPSPGGRETTRQGGHPEQGFRPQVRCCGPPG